MKSPLEILSSNIVLIGYRGCGKTSVAKELSNLTGRSSVDTDELIKQRTGKSIAEIFSDEGEMRFRQYEHDIIAELTQQPPKILSVGGGAIIDPQNVANLHSIGIVFWLQATAEILRKRIKQHDATLTDRPALRGNNPFKEIDSLLIERSPLYKNAATHTIDTAHLTQSAIATRIIEMV